jgi:hypothetical protein
MQRSKNSQHARPCFLSGFPDKKAGPDIGNWQNVSIAAAWHRALNFRNSFLVQYFPSKKVAGEQSIPIGAASEIGRVDPGQNSSDEASPPQPAVWIEGVSSLFRSFFVVRTIFYLGLLASLTRAPSQTLTELHFEWLVHAEQFVVTRSTFDGIFELGRIS